MLRNFFKSSNRAKIAPSGPRSPYTIIDTMRNYYNVAENSFYSGEERFHHWKQKNTLDENQTISAKEIISCYKTAIQAYEKAIACYTLDSTTEEFHEDCDQYLFTIRIRLMQTRMDLINVLCNLAQRYETDTSNEKNAHTALAFYEDIIKEAKPTRLACLMCRTLAIAIAPHEKNIVERIELSLEKMREVINKIQEKIKILSAPSTSISEIVTVTPTSKTTPNESSEQTTAEADLVITISPKSTVPLSQLFKPGSAFTPVNHRKIPNAEKLDFFYSSLSNEAVKACAR